MKITSIVRPLKIKDSLHADGDWWSFAVVCSLEPFILVSVDTEIMWYHDQPDDLEVIGVAIPRIFNNCQCRLKPKDQCRILERSMGNVGPELLPEGFEWTQSPLRKQMVYVLYDARGGRNDLWGWVFEKEGDFWRAKHNRSNAQMATTQAALDEVANLYPDESLPRGSCSIG